MVRMPDLDEHVPVTDREADGPPQRFKALVGCGPRHVLDYIRSTANKDRPRNEFDFGTEYDLWFTLIRQLRLDCDWLRGTLCDDIVQSIFLLPGFLLAAYLGKDVHRTYTNAILVSIWHGRIDPELRETITDELFSIFYRDEYISEATRNLAPLQGFIDGAYEHSKL